jgi:hypothetical protein
MTDQVSKHDQVLLALVLNLQSVAMVQLGKVTNPVSGAIERDLDAARGTIDILEMFKNKCRTDTAAPVLRLLDQAVMDLQMNYLDEIKAERNKEEDNERAAADGRSSDTAGEGSAEQTGQSGSSKT